MERKITIEVTYEELEKIKNGALNESKAPTLADFSLIDIKNELLLRSQGNIKETRYISPGNLKETTIIEGMVDGGPLKVKFEILEEK